ncbi:ATP phosphoribosyltransferase, partial [Striga asiatica]
LSNPGIPYHLINQNFGTVEADTTENTENNLHESYVKHGLRKLQVAKVTWALSHVGHTRLTLHLPINCPQTWVAQAPNLRLTSFRGLAVLYNYDLVRAEYAELDNADFGNLRRGIWEPQIHGVPVDDT